MGINNLFQNIELREIEFIDFAGLLFAAVEPLHDSQDELAAIFSILDIENKSKDTKNIINNYLINPPSLQNSIERLSNLNQETKLLIYLKVYSVLSVSRIDNVKEEILNSIRSGFLISKKQDKRLRNEFIDLTNNLPKLLYRTIPLLTGVLAVKSLKLIGIGAASIGLVSNPTLFTSQVGSVTRFALFVSGFLLGRWFNKKRAEQIRVETGKRAFIVIMRLQSTIIDLNKKLIELEEISELAWYKEYCDKIKSKLKDLNDAKKFYEKLQEAAK